MRSKRADKGEGFFFLILQREIERERERERQRAKAKTIQGRRDGSGQRSLTVETTSRGVDVSLKQI